MSQNASKVPDCKVCLVAHDEDIHNATLNVHRWFGAEVTKHFEDRQPELEEEVVFAGSAA